MHQPFIHMMRFGGDRNSCGYAGGHQSFPLILEECGSGMDARRPKLQQLIKMVMRNEIRNVYVTHRDRLARFGFEYLETAFAEHGTNIIAVRDGSQDKAVQEELVEDMMSLMASFSGKALWPEVPQGQEGRRAMTLDELAKQVGRNGVERMLLEYAMLMKAKADKCDEVAAAVEDGKSVEEIRAIVEC